MRSLIFLFLFLLMGCRTVDPNMSAHTNNVTKGGEGVGKLSETCPLQPTACIEIYSPSTCEVDTYLKDGEVSNLPLKTWDDNHCFARQALLQKACDRSLELRLLGEIRCVPDPSEGNCPYKATACKTSGEKFACESRQYGSQFLHGENILIAQGSGECQAMNALKNIACMKNLNPDLVSQITCKIIKK